MAKSLGSGFHGAGVMTIHTVQIYYKITSGTSDSAHPGLCFFYTFNLLSVYFYYSNVDKAPGPVPALIGLPLCFLNMCSMVFPE